MSLEVFSRPTISSPTSKNGLTTKLGQALVSAGCVDGWPHPAVTRTLQHAADIASSRNGQQMSAKSLQHRWKHETQRAAMTQAVLPAEWLLDGIIDRALSHWARAPPLCGGDDGGDADTGADTAIPDDDDDDDIASLSPVNNPHHSSIQASSSARSPLLGCLLS